MAGFFKWLFGSREEPTLRQEAKSGGSAYSEPEYFNGPSLPGQPYFVQLERLTSSVSAKDYRAAAAAARESLRLLREWLSDPRGNGQRLDIRIPALSQGGTMMAIVGDWDGLCELRRLVQEFDHLEAYRKEAEEHFVDLDLLERLRMAIRSNPGIPQNRIKAELGLDEGRRASRLISYLEKSGEVRRAKNGKSFDLYIADASMPYPASRRHQGRA
jgi:hypothetical protein